jgi:hypothetical protein
VKRNDPTLEALRRANPAPEESTTGWHASAEGRQVAARALAEAPEVPEISTRRSRRPRVLVALVAAVAALALGAKLGDSVPQETKTPNQASCYLILDPHSDRDFAVLNDRTPVEACAAFVKQHYSLTPSHLAACVLNEGGTGVFPHEDSRSAKEVCISMGLDPLGTSP